MTLKELGKRWRGAGWTFINVTSSGPVDKDVFIGMTHPREQPEILFRIPERQRARHVLLKTIMEELNSED